MSVWASRWGGTESFCLSYFFSLNALVPPCLQCPLPPSSPCPEALAADDPRIKKRQAGGGGGGGDGGGSRQEVLPVIAAYIPNNRRPPPALGVLGGFEWALVRIMEDAKKHQDVILMQDASCLVTGHANNF